MYQSREDLEDLLRDPTYFDAFFGTLDRVQALYDAHDELLRRNEELTGELVMT
jgi:Modifier of rudimentary (Mod(r)) protein